MRLTMEERRYLREFQKELRKKGSDGWLAEEEAGKRSGVDSEGGNLAQRLAQRNLLKQKKGGYPEFAITPLGEYEQRCWFRRHLKLILIIVFGVSGWILWAIERILLK